jgi:hypothetical protein
VVITLRNNNGARYGIAAGALVVLLSAIAFSKRKSEGFGAEEEVEAPLDDQVGKATASVATGA